MGNTKATIDGREYSTPYVPPTIVGFAGIDPCVIHSDTGEGEKQEIQQAVQEAMAPAMTEMQEKIQELTDAVQALIKATDVIVNINGCQSVTTTSI